MSNSARRFSTAVSSVNQLSHVSVSNADDALPAGGGPALGPVKDCWAILIIDHGPFVADTRLMTRVGFPADYQRSSQPGAPQTVLSKKRLQVQFPTATLKHDRIVHAPVVRTVTELLRARQAGGSSFGARGTIFQIICEDLVGVQKRVLTTEGLSLLFNGPDVRSATLFYPPHVVLTTPQWAAPSTSTGKKLLFAAMRKSTSARSSSAPAFARASVKWATCFFTSPAPPGSVDLQDDPYSRVKRERIILDRLSAGESYEAVLARLRPPSSEREQMLSQLLRHLEHRGIIWNQAGHTTKPSLLNSDPRVRPQFVVQGLYPEPFLDRCKAYCRAGASAHGKNCMQAENRESHKSPKAPLITTCVTEDDDSTMQDFLQGWHVKVILEPFQSGSPVAVGPSPTAG